jgi:dTDP-4-dehydrorhamnose reductase
MKRVLVIGGKGMLGHKLVQCLGDKGLDVWTTLHSTFDEVERFGIFGRERTIEKVDVTDIDSVKKAIETAKPDVIINAVGVVKQLPEAADIVNTLLINSIFPHRLAEVALRAGARLILISTDCVFDGKDGNYSEDDTPNALDLYGQSKQFGEVAADNCLTIRTSIIGRELVGSHSLVEWFLSNRGGSVKGYINAIYSGFPTIVFADIIATLITEHTGLSGLYHISSEPIDKFTLLTLINDAYDAGISVGPDEEFRIDRSLDSTRFRRATGLEPPSWKTMVEQIAADPTPYDEFRR